MNKELPSYGKVLAVGHRAISTLFNDEVEIQEKIDGSQFSFGQIDGKPFCRSRNSQINMDDPEGMFARGVETVRGLCEAGLLKDGLVYRGEYLSKPKHNTLCYERIPRGHIMLFGVDDMETNSNSMRHLELKDTAEALGLEVIPLIFNGKIEYNPESLEALKGLLERESVLGGANIEGIVIKSFTQFNEMNHRPCVGKIVSDHFKEKHKVDWKKTSPNKSDTIDALIQSLTTEARWRKGIERLRDSGEDVDGPECIGKLIKAVQVDVKEEEEEFIKDALFKGFWGDIQRGIVRGLPEWHKKNLEEASFNQ